MMRWEEGIFNMEIVKDGKRRPLSRSSPTMLISGSELNQKKAIVLQYLQFYIIIFDCMNGHKFVCVSF